MRKRTPRRSWTPAELDTLRELYADTLTERIAEIVGHSLRSVYGKAFALGLKKSPEHVATHCRTRDGSLGVRTRFKPGQRAWNKGLNYQAAGRSMETQFKPGVRSGRAVRLYQPIGAERVTKDGYLQRKMNDDMPCRLRWKLVHILVWEAANGQVPRGHVVVFKDGNTRNLDIANLALITRAENMRRNSYHRYPKEIALVIQTRGALTRQINLRIKRNEKQT